MEEQCVLLNTISEELNVQGNINDFIEVYMDYKNKHFGIFKRDDEDQFFMNIEMKM